MKHRFIFTLFLSLHTIICFCQENVGDSLIKILKTAKQDSNKVISLNQLCIYLRNHGDLDSALTYSKEMLHLASTIDFKKGVGNAYNSLGLIQRDLGNYPEAIKNLFAAIQIQDSLSDKKGLAYSYNNLGGIYRRQGNNEEALKNNLKALKIQTQSNDKKGISLSYNNLGGIYHKMGDYSESLKMFLIALKIRKEIDYKLGIGSTYNNIGIVYNSQKKYSDALENYFKALKITEEVNDKIGTETVFVNLCAVYKNIKDYKKAEEFGLKGLALSSEIGDLESVMEANQNLSESYSDAGNPDKALKYYKSYIIIRDSLNNKETEKKTLQYEYDKKEVTAKIEQEKKDELALAEKRKQSIVLIFVSCFTFIFLILLIFIFNRFKVTQKQRNIIELKEKETQHQKELIQEKHKEITDSINYAERIQRSFLATKENLDANLTDYFVLFKPKDVVSGDFYWSGNLTNTIFLLATADSTGHGVPGAIMSLLNITSLEKAVEHSIIEPSKILDYTRKEIITRLKKDGSLDGGKDGMDCSLCMYDFKNLKLSIATANNPVWIVRGVEAIEIKPDKMPVGKHDRQDIPFTQHEIQLQKGDVVYTLTDGFPDQFGGAKGKKFMNKNLRELLVSNANLPMNEQKNLLEETFSDWIGILEQVDDVTLIGVRV